MSKTIVKDHSILKVSEGTNVYTPKPGEKHTVSIDSRNTSVTKDRQFSLKDHEIKLKLEFQETLDKEIEKLKEQFEIVLQNEQFRTAFLLRQAHREKEERIASLQAQLECKNMAGLMYVLCTERRQNHMEQCRIIEDYTNYINYLQDLLHEGQQIILHLSREYKTAARVDHEWREKMSNVLHEFQRFILDYSGCTKEGVQNLFDFSELLNVKAPKVQDPKEDPCDEEAVVQKEKEPQKQWFEKMDCGPFVVFGDMEHFDVHTKREVLRKIKAKKTAPSKWKEYAFNGMSLQRKCDHTDEIKNKFPKHQSQTSKVESHGVQTTTASSLSHQCINRRHTSTSVDFPGNNQMGSILKLMSSTPYRFSETKALLLGARDSMEIASCTKLMKNKKNGDSQAGSHIHVKGRPHGTVGYTASSHDPPLSTIKLRTDDEFENQSIIGSMIRDSIQLIHQHVPDRDATIAEKICPVEKCRNLKMDSFMKALPLYMRSGPYYHFEQTFEDYEVCSPEQLKVIRERLERSVEKHTPKVDPLDEWKPPVEGISCQTSFPSIPECDCQLKHEFISEEPSEIVTYHVEDLAPAKKMIDHIKKECLFDDTIEFNRFNVVGQEWCNCNTESNKGDFKNRLDNVKEVLTKHPSICSLFQANT